MKRKNVISQEIKTFKKWTNTSWSVFSSLGKQIRIGLLPLSYFLCSVFTLDAQTDTIPIENIEIISTRVPLNYSEVGRVIYTIEKEEINSMPVRSLQDLIEYVCNVDVRQRGSEGVQADISIRGGNFDQTLILLNGFKMNDVQTGHHNMNLPVDIESIEKIEILQGPGNRVFGINSYSGAINFITSSSEEKKLKLSFCGGQHNYLGGHASVNFNIKNWHQYLAVSGKRSDGHLNEDSINNTDFNILNLFYESGIKTQSANFIIQAGFSDKSFGANSFYTPAYPWQYENTKTVYAGYRAVKNGKKYSFLKSFYWRRHQDRFELFREDMYQRTDNYFIFDNDTAGFGGGYFYGGHNYHKTNLISSELKFTTLTIFGKTAFGAEYRHAFIQSNVLGNDMPEPVDVPFEEFGQYTKEANRSNMNIFAENAYTYKKITLAAGISYNHNSDYKGSFNGGADLNYALTKQISLFAAANKATRLPTFTDLYYDGPVNIGNPELQPEHAISYELGMKYIKSDLLANISVFKREGKNTIDWVRLADTLQWQPQNITELSTYGFEFAGSYKFPENNFLRKLSVSYSYLNIEKMPSDYQSKYVLDYLKHKAVFSLHHSIYGNLSAKWNVRFEDRNEQFSPYDTDTRAYTEAVDYEPYLLTDLKVFWNNRKLEIFVEASNLFNTEYYDYGNIKMPGRWIKAGIKRNINM